jgi:hypothetical protein
MTTRHLAAKLEVAWDSLNWANETAYLENVSGGTSLEGDLPGEIGGSVACDLTAVLRNASNRFSSDNSSGPYYTHIKDGGAFRRPIRLSLSVDGGVTYIQVFTGLIETLAEQHVERRFTIRAMDKSRKLQEVHTSTALFANKRVDEYIQILGIAGGFMIDDMALDRGTAILPWTWVDDEPIWPEIAMAAEAEGGRAYFDMATGKLTFKNSYWDVRKTTLDTTPSCPTGIYQVASFKDIERGYRFDELWNKVVVEWTLWGLGARAVVYEGDEVWVIPPGGTQYQKKFDVKFNAPCSVVYTPVYNATKKSRSDYIATSGAGVDITTSVVVAVNAGAQNARVTVTNNHATCTAYINKFRLQGRPLEGAPVRKYEVPEGITTDRTYRVPFNHYIQTPAAARFIGDLIYARCQTPRRVYSLPIPGDPARYAGHRVQVQDVFGNSRDCLVRGVEWEYSRSGYSMTLDLVDLAILFPPDGSSYFVLGTTQWGSGSSSKGRLWF